jgi:hypothetical protein
MNTNENTASARYDIAEHLDPSGEIHAGSNAADEFNRWQEHAAENPSEWTGAEFTLGDFESYIAEARSQYDAPTLALADYLGEDPANVTEERGLECGMTIYSVGSREYIVGTDDEANEAWDQALDAQLDECGGLLADFPEHLVPYFDRTAWKRDARDARHDGRGHALALYDGNELELAGDLYAFRIS